MNALPKKYSMNLQVRRQAVYMHALISQRPAIQLLDAESSRVQLAQAANRLRMHALLLRGCKHLVACVACAGGAFHAP
jgi:hypothetical protein